MTITTDELHDAVLSVAASTYGEGMFRRRPLMLAVERYIRQAGFWTDSDDELSGSAGEKSAGLAKIDWSISRLKRQGRLLSVGFNRWKLPPNNPRNS